MFDMVLGNVAILLPGARRENGSEGVQCNILPVDDPKLGK
jgi:hypothetical protein